MLKTDYDDLGSNPESKTDNEDADPVCQFLASTIKLLDELSLTELDKKELAAIRGIE